VYGRGSIISGGGLVSVLTNHLQVAVQQLAVLSSEDYPDYFRGFVLRQANIVDVSFVRWVGLQCMVASSSSDPHFSRVFGLDRFYLNFSLKARRRSVMYLNQRGYTANRAAGVHEAAQSSEAALAAEGRSAPKGRALWSTNPAYATTALSAEELHAGEGSQRPEAEPSLCDSGTAPVEGSGEAHEVEDGGSSRGQGGSWQRWRLPEPPLGGQTKALLNECATLVEMTEPLGGGAGHVKNRSKWIPEHVRAYSVFTTFALIFIHPTVSTVCFYVFYCDGMAPAGRPSPRVPTLPRLCSLHRLMNGLP
ncbi:hypothetical protein CYMTET_36227, partial [Cymbomonas tetramitiformis]